MHLPALLLTSALAAAGSPAPPLDISRYAGDWYVIAQASDPAASGPARLEYRAQGDEVEERRYAALVAPAGEPALLATRHWTTDRDDTARWTESSWWPFGARLTVLYVSPDYRQSLVDGPEGPQVLAREPRLAEWIYAGLLARLAALGYDVSALRRSGPAPGTE